MQLKIDRKLLQNTLAIKVIKHHDVLKKCYHNEDWHLYIFNALVMQSSFDYVLILNN